MKKTIISIAALSALLLASCESYLDMQPIERFETPEEIFSVKATTNQYLNQIYGFIPREFNTGAAATAAGAGLPWLPCCDEIESSFNNEYVVMNDGTWTPSTAEIYQKWQFFYNGIREANYFLNYVDLCEEYTPEELRLRKAEARFLRAYFYTYLMKMYGPVPLIGDKVNDPNEDFTASRNTYDDCVEYVVRELDDVATMLLPQHPDPDRGRATSGMAMGLKSRFLLYVASELFNPRGGSIYSDYKNKEGVNLIPTTFDIQKWEDAAQAALDVIELSSFQLVKEYTTVDVEGVPTEVIDPYGSLYSVFFSAWNSEVIWGRKMADNTWFQRTTPRGVGAQAWGGFGVTQQHVDAYAMASGKYPIDPVYTDAGYSYEIVPGTGYTEEGWTANFEHPYDGIRNDTWNMYIGREPRFYMDIVWAGMKYPFALTSARGKVPEGTTTLATVEFFNGGNSGAPGQNRSMTGYCLRKINSRTASPRDNTWATPMIWSYMRLAEIYLNYIEATIECGRVDDALMFALWDELRERAGLPGILSVYPEATGNQNMLRDLLRRERRIELAFEGLRYFDTRRWMIAEDTDAGPMYGMNVMETTQAPGTAFWQRTKTSRADRVFKEKHYLHPVKQRQIDRDSEIEQSPYWQ